jgi:uncharacterized membrane protein
MEKGRLEAFSDGVIAIAITLLVLNIHVPAPEGGHLAHRLGEQWPSYAAYVVSFLTIGIIWINHHAMIRRLRAADHSLLVLNMLLLLSIGALPFTTALIAEYLRASSGQHLAAAIYAGSLLAMSLLFYAMQHHILYARRRLLLESIRDEDRDAIERRNRTGLLPYLVATALAPVSSYVTLAICGVVAAFYAWPPNVESAREPSPE